MKVLFEVFTATNLFVYREVNDEDTLLPGVSGAMGGQ